MEKKREEEKENKEEKRREKISKDILDYSKKILKGDYKFQNSEDGFPLCPVCEREFKDTDTVIKHLMRNKKEYEEIKFSEDDFPYDPPRKIEAEILKSKDELEIRVGDSCFIFDYLKDKDTTGIKDSIFEHIMKSRLRQEIRKMKQAEWSPKKKFIVNKRNAISSRLRFEILKRDGYTCQYCGRKPPKVELEVDHIEPYSKTRDNNPENLITACEDCNRGKRTRDVV